jgi:16S rRNA (cytosine1402-N4)-methyltransferase
MDVYHKPILVTEVVKYLVGKAGGLYVDVTFGGGGHTRALLEADPACTVIACDWDEQALRMNGDSLQEQYPDRIQLVWGNFSRIQHHLKKLGIHQVDGILADFGTSQYQIYHQEGFSFRTSSPLDMRMSKGHFEKTAADIVNRSSEQELMHILYEYGEERHAARIVREIIASRPFKTTVQLADAITRVVPRGNAKIHPATKTFQALRMVVNHELENIHSFLLQTAQVIRPGGRLACISFHSIEDREVKYYLRDHPQQWEVITKRVVTASDVELAENPSSRSAKLRCAQRR